MNTKKMIGINVATLIVVGGLAIGGVAWYNNATNYISTDNASITGTMITVTAPANGTLTNWNGTEGQAYKSGDALGSEQIVTIGANGKSVTTQQTISMPTDATIVQQDTYANEQLAAGTPLAYAYNLNQLYVQANIKETQIQNVKVGDKVDVYVDAYKNETFSGTVASIGKATMSTFSLLPQNNDTGNFTKVTQLLPVKIQLNNSGYTGLAPGMSVEVRIHRN